MADDRFSDSQWFIDAMGRSAGDLYLGDKKVVHELIAGLARDVVDRFAAVQAGTCSREEALAADRAACLMLGTVLNGNTPGFSGVKGWNDGGLARYLQTTVGLAPDETDGDLIVAHGLARMLVGIYRAFTAGDSEEAIAADIKAQIESTTLLMMGVQGND